MKIPQFAVARRLNTEPATPDQPVVRTMPVSFGYKLRRIQMAYKRLLLQLAGPDCIPTNQIGALSVISRNPGITPGEIANLMTMDAAQLTPIIKQLVSREMVIRERSATDSRSHALYATPLGISEYKRMQVIIAQVDDIFIGRVLDDEEIIRFSDMLDKVLLADRMRDRSTA